MSCIAVIWGPLISKRSPRPRCCRCRAYHRGRQESQNEAGGLARRATISRDQVLDHRAAELTELLESPGMVKSELVVIKAEESQQRAVEVTDVGLAFDSLHSEFVGRADGMAGVATAACEPDRHRVGIMVATVGSALAQAVVRRAAKLHPPTERRKSWFAYWTGLRSSKSTGHSKIDEAVKAVEAMLQNGGNRSVPLDSILTDEEFVKLQRHHFGRKTDPAAKARAARSLEECEDAISAFKVLSGLEHISLATPDDCAAFQRTALSKTVNWRRSYPKGKPVSNKISPNTVLKWSRSLQAAFDRANKFAGKRKCVRGVVDERKLLTLNPWSQFTWIEGKKKAIRHFSGDELRSLLTFFSEEWADVPVGKLAAQVLFWSCCRKLEVASLTWDSLRQVRQEFHFEIVGKWGVKRYFRVPERLFEQLMSARLPSSQFVFAAYCEQVRQAPTDNPGWLKKIRAEFDPKNFGSWFYARIKEWSASQSNGNANVHVFRKTSLQLAFDGDEVETSRKVADDAGVSESVLLGHYVNLDLWRKSNRTYYRILATLPADLAALFGYVESAKDQLGRELEAAKARGDWSQVAKLAAEPEALNRKPRNGR